MIKSRTLFAALAAGTFVLGACSADSTDFKAAAEKFITGKDGLGDGSSATCDKPENTDTGTTFNCTGTDADGVEYAFIASIDSKTKVSIDQVAGDAPAEDTTEETVAEDTTETTEA